MVEGDDGIVQALHRALSRNFGASAAKAIEFYFDPSIAIDNPEAYQRMLTNVFASGADHLLRIMVGELCVEFNVQQDGEMTIAQCITAIRTRPTA